MDNKNKLSIYLLKTGKEDMIDIFDDKYRIEVFQKYDNNSTAYYVPSNAREPQWLKSFFHKGADGKLLQANSRVILLKPIEIDSTTRLFALSFGYARFMFKDNVLEEQFGLRIVLNSIKQDQIRRISKASVGSNQKQSDEQLPKNSDISEFGFDINRDLMKNVSGKSDDDIFENSMLTGGDVFSLTVSRDIDNIDEFLRFCYKRYCEDTYKEKFAWIDNIKKVKDKKIINQLNESLIDEINTKNYNNAWMAVPEVISWEEIKDFTFSGTNETYNDIYIDKVVESLRNDLRSIEQLKSKRIIARSSRDDSQSAYEWSAYKCIVAEIALDGQQYCLSDGKWYRINTDYVSLINKQYDSLSLCTDEFLDYSHHDEDQYNDELHQTLTNSYLLHKYKVAVGGGQGNNFEPCDILWNNRLIHIKRNGNSSVLSHLFNQALVSSQMLLDASVRSQLRRKMIDAGEGDVIHEPFSAQDYEIVLAIINKFNDERPKIPFFSKVSLCFTSNSIQNLGYKLSLKNIRTN